MNAASLRVEPVERAGTGRAEEARWSSDERQPAESGCSRRPSASPEYRGTSSRRMENETDSAPGREGTVTAARFPDQVSFRRAGPPSLVSLRGCAGVGLGEAIVR